MKKPIALPATLIAALALAACSADDGTDAASAEARIAFAPAEVSSSAATRGAQATASTITSYSVSCSVYGSDESYTSAAIGSYFYNITPDEDGTTDYYWPTDQYKVSFFAYSPANNSNITLSSANTLGRPTYTYTVPEDIREQVDFMTAEATDVSKPASSDYKQPLQFTHRCAGIAFNLINNFSQSITLKSITICGLKSTGSLTGNNWSLETSTKDYTVTSNKEIASKETTNVTETTGPFLMLPQSIAADATWIKVVARTYGSTDRTFTYSLPSALTLTAGQTLTYNLSIGNDGLIVDATTSITDWSSDVTTFTVNEYGTTIKDWTKQEQE